MHHEECRHSNYGPVPVPPSIGRGMRRRGLPVPLSTKERSDGIRTHRTTAKWSDRESFTDTCTAANRNNNNRRKKPPTFQSPPIAGPKSFHAEKNASDWVMATSQHGGFDVVKVLQKSSTVSNTKNILNICSQIENETIPGAGAGWWLRQMSNSWMAKQTFQTWRHFSETIEVRSRA